MPPRLAFKLCDKLFVRETDGWKINFTWLSVFNFQIGHGLSILVVTGNYLFLKCILCAFFSSISFTRRREVLESNRLKKVGRYTAVPRIRNREVYIHPQSLNSTFSVLNFSVAAWSREENNKQEFWLSLLKIKKK